MSDDTLQKATEYSKFAMLRMEFLGLPPTPNNYALLYTYASGRLPEIKSIVDESVRKGGMNVTKAQEIFQKYLGGDKEREILENNVKSLTEELGKVMTVISSARTGTDQFTETLSGFNTSLNKPLSVDELRSTVAKVISETKEIAKQNQELHEKLAQSSQQMNVMREDLSRVQKESLTDPLTGVGNRKHFVNELKRMVFEADDQKTALSLMMIDIDFFKKFDRS